VSSNGVDLPPLTTRLAAETLSARRARHFVVDAVHRLGMEAVADAAALLTTELVTNAVLHGQGEVAVRVSNQADAVRIEVDDDSAAAPELRSFGTHAATGRGMLLVEALSRAWGCDPNGAGKTVWFELVAEDE
jgi:two-component sensor histidine kinase